MPIYSYRCDQCGHQQDVLQKMSDPLLVTCPSCGQATYRKQVTAAGFQLKGSGWYVTDFRNPATKEATKGVAKPEGGGAEKSTTSESSTTAEAAKPATTSETKSEASPAAKPAAGGGGSGGTS